MSQLGKPDIDKQEKVDLIKEAASLEWHVEVNECMMSSPLYNPNFCDNCGIHTSYGQFGACLECGQKNPIAETVFFCRNCRN